MQGERFTSGRVPDPGIGKLFAIEERWQSWLDVEAALSHSQAELGILPRESAEAIAAACDIRRLDLGNVRNGVARMSHPFMPLVTEAMVSMLACARIGAVQSVVFGGFAAKELATRIDDAQPKLVITKHRAGAFSIELELDDAARTLVYRRRLDVIQRQLGSMQQYEEARALFGAAEKSDAEELVLVRN